MLAPGFHRLRAASTAAEGRPDIVAMCHSLWQSASMAKRFILRWRHGCGPMKTATILVSDEDAHFPRNKIYHIQYDKDGRPVCIQCKPAKGNVNTTYLAREITCAAEQHEVVHLNGDALDCRRSNLRLQIKWTSLSRGGNAAKYRKNAVK